MYHTVVFEPDEHTTAVFETCDLKHVCVCVSLKLFKLFPNSETFHQFHQHIKQWVCWKEDVLQNQNYDACPSRHTLHTIQLTAEKEYIRFALSVTTHSSYDPIDSWKGRNTYVLQNVWRVDIVMMIVCQDILYANCIPSSLTVTRRMHRYI